MDVADGSGSSPVVERGFPSLPNVARWGVELVDPREVDVDVLPFWDDGCPPSRVDVCPPLVEDVCPPFLVGVVHSRKSATVLALDGEECAAAVVVLVWVDDETGEGRRVDPAVRVDKICGTAV